MKPYSGAYLLLAVATSLARLSAQTPPQPAIVQGNIENPGEKYGAPASYRLSGDTLFGWQTGAITGDLDLSGHTLTMETGGGNRTVFSGGISGTGAIEWRGGGVPQVAPSILDGAIPNSFKGPFTLTNGVLDLQKRNGACAIPGDLIIGTRGDATVRVFGRGQIGSSSVITMGGAGISSLEVNGAALRVRALSLRTHAILAFGSPALSSIETESPGIDWDLTKTLTITGFKPGKDRIVLGSTEFAMTPAMRSRIGFQSPQGMPEGLYRAKVDAKGNLVPADQVRAIAAPFDVSSHAAFFRSRLYDIDGLHKIAASSSLFRDDCVIDLFGDSITWLNGYKSMIEEALRTGGSKAVVINRGINGGGVAQIRDGAKEGGYPGNSAQEGFSSLLASDRATLAVVFIGINDVWWRKTTPEDFEKGMRELAQSARDRHVRLVFATMTLHGELPDGKNPDDPKIDQYCQITRRVAAESHTTLVDLRSAYIAYLQNHNAMLRVDGSLYSKPSGVLTYDGVHPNTEGVKLLANLIGDGVVRSMAAK